MKHVHLLPNVITAFGLSCGLFVIFKMNMAEPGTVTVNALMAIAGILLLACLADLLDGAVARATKSESDFGGLFDSLADAITFGVSPPVIILKTLSIHPGTSLSFFLTTSAMVFAVCGVLRLVRYNLLSKKASNDPEMLKAHNKNFTGLPIPAAAAAAVSANLLLMSDEFVDLMTLSEIVRVSVMTGVQFCLGYFMICRLKFPSLKSLHIRVASFQVVFLTVLFAVIVFYGIINHFALMFFVFSWIYILIALTLSLIRLISGRKSKRLEDFEPEPDDDQ